MARLTEVDIMAGLEGAPGWALEAGGLVREWRFATFRAAIDFVNRVAAVAEEVNHHPDFEIIYDRVRLRLVSHDVKRVNARDIRMAVRLSDEFPFVS